MRWSIREKVNVGFGAALLILSVIGVVSYRSTIQLVETSHRVAHTHKVLTELEAVFSHVKDAQRGERGYIITGQQRYLEPYHTAVEKIPQEIGRLRQWTADNPVQQRRLDDLEPLITRELNVFEQIINLQKTNGWEAAAQAVRTGEGRKIMEEIRRVIGEMKDEERRLLELRSKRAEASARNTIFIIALGSLLAFTLISLAIFIINSDITKRKRAEEALQKAHDELETRVRERTVELANTNEELRTEIAERKRAEEALQQQLTRISLLNHIIRAIAERQDLESIFRVVLRRLEDHLPIDYGCVCTYDDASDMLTIATHGSRSQPPAAAWDVSEGAAIPVEQTGLRACVEGKVVYVSDTTEVDAPIPRKLAQASIRSLVATPLAVEDEVIGILVVMRREVDDFSSADSEFLRMLSEHIALAAHHARLHGKLQQAYDELRQTQQSLMQQDRLRALGQMASGIAHDINNALSPVIGLTDVLLNREPNLSDTARECLELIQMAGEDVTSIVARMREFYRRRGEKEVLLPVNLHQLSQQVIDLTRPRWRDIPQEKGVVIDVQTDFQDALPPVLGIESELREALTNLIINAVDAMPDGGTVTVRTYESPTRPHAHAPTHVVVEISDTGVGMNEETRQRCLEPFYSTKGELGTGLGLAMVYGMMQRHEGDIAIESELGKGTTVRLIFPARQLESAAVATHPEVITPTVSLRILCIDDEPLLRKTVKEMLESDGHTVEVADGGQAGIDTFRAAQERSEPFDVVLTDLGMPYMDGREVVRTVKRESPTTPVILLTGWGTRIGAEDAFPVEVDAMLSKPPRVNNLREALQQVMSRRTA